MRTDRKQLAAIRSDLRTGTSPTGHSGFLRTQSATALQIRGHDGPRSIAMTKPSAAQIERAKRLLASEGSAGELGGVCGGGRAGLRQARRSPGPAARSAACKRCSRVARSWRKSSSRPSPRSPTVAKARRSCGAHLQSLEPAVATETAAALFGTFLDLITTFIGDRLTVQVLRSAWPTIEETPPRETDK